MRVRAECCVDLLRPPRLPEKWIPQLRRELPTTSRTASYQNMILGKTLATSNLVVMDRRQTCPRTTARSFVMPNYSSACGPVTVHHKRINIAVRLANSFMLHLLGLPAGRGILIRFTTAVHTVNALQPLRLPGSHSSASSNCNSLKRPCPASSSSNARIILGDITPGRTKKKK
jgi:hypothetical protein